MWSVDYVSPTPSDGANLPGSSVTISASVTPTILKEAAPKAITHTAMDFNSTGTLTGMQMNSTDNSVQLSYPNYAGNYISAIYDATENVSWDNMSWSELLPVDGELEPSSDICFMLKPPKGAPTLFFLCLGTPHSLTFLVLSRKEMEVEDDVTAGKCYGTKGLNG